MQSYNHHRTEVLPNNSRTKVEAQSDTGGAVCFFTGAFLSGFYFCFMIFAEFLKVSFNFFSLPSLMYLVSYVFSFAFVSMVVLCGGSPLFFDAMYCGSLWLGLFDWVLFVYLFCLILFVYMGGVGVIKGVVPIGSGK